MPTYSYVCSTCEHAFDVHQAFSDDPLTTCPACERETLRKVFSPVGVVFKGSGFYRTDSRAKARASGSSSSTGASTTPPPSSDSSAGGSSSSASSTGSSSTGSSSSGGSPSSGGTASS